MDVEPGQITSQGSTPASVQPVETTGPSRQTVQSPRNQESSAPVAGSSREMTGYQQRGFRDPYEELADEGWDNPESDIYTSAPWDGEEQ